MLPLKIVYKAHDSGLASGRTLLTSAVDLYRQTERLSSCSKQPGHIDIEILIEGRRKGQRKQCVGVWEKEEPSTPTHLMSD